MTKLDLTQIKIECIEDKPSAGMWHCGPNPCWITATHIPSGTSVRVYSGNKVQHQARVIALDALELVLEETGAESCSFPENIKEKS